MPGKTCSESDEFVGFRTDVSLPKTPIQQGMTTETSGPDSLSMPAVNAGLIGAGIAPSSSGSPTRPLLDAAPDTPEPSSLTAGKLEIRLQDKCTPQGSSRQRSNPTPAMTRCFFSGSALSKHEGDAGTATLTATRNQYLR